MASLMSAKRKDLSPIVHLYEPLSQAEDTAIKSDATSSGPPNLIILAGWAGAKLRPISKYVQGYQRLYPAARILVTQSQFFDLAFRTLRSTQKRLDPALEVVQAAACANERILLHSLSNGGAFIATQLAVKYRLATGNPLPIRAHIIDSAPGVATIRRGMAASAAAAPKGWLRPLVLGVLYAFCFTIWLTSRVFKTVNVVDRIRRGLLNNEILAAKRQISYIYSKTDQVIGFEDVEEHATEAEEKGLKVKRVVYEKSAHVAHAVADPGRYWSTVSETWEQA
ncbi:MAG: hypothetical protein M1822_005520 [Bathelium mastoideum]|nr:MAG: hypothetical protein M1822_005520 [Bathelium mastoideum]